jgi:hypothetical protein
VTERDHLGGDAQEPLAQFASALGEAGLCIAECRQATVEDVAALNSSWAKRLGVPRRRPAWLLAAHVHRRQVLDLQQ